MPGGIPDVGMERVVEKFLKGKGKLPDLPRMLERDPHFNDCWRDYVADVEKITTPAYVVSSYANKVHVRGTQAAWERIASAEKWLRIHNTHEWKDFYTHQDDLKRFFDHYLKGEDNGWEQTPHVRASVLNPGGVDVVDRPEEDYPLPRTDWQTLYLCADGSMRTAPLAAPGSTNYQADDGKGRADFVYTFDEGREFIGNIRMKLWVSADSADDLDLFVMGEKIAADGTALPVMVKGAPYCKDGQAAPFEWGNGRLRVSALLSDTKDAKVRPGEVVPVEIELCPMGMVFEPGQRLRISVHGYNPQGAELPMQKPTPTINRGRHTIWCGGDYDSHIEIPVTA